MADSAASRTVGVGVRALTSQPQRGLSPGDTRGRPYHPMTQRKIEGYQRSIKSVVRIENHYSPGELEREGRPCVTRRVKLEGANSRTVQVSKSF